MICYRRCLRKQILVFVFILFVGLWFFIKSRSFVIVNERSQNELLNEGFQGSQDNDRETALELERLSGIETEKEHIREHEEMMRKYNESLKRQAIEEDAFHPKHLIESKYTDFSNFKINFTETVYKPLDLISAVEKLNNEQIIYNREKLKSLPKGYVVIVVQVHRRVEYFKELLDSLQRSKGIEKSLLVVSHDYYTDEMNALVRMIKFCPVSIDTFCLFN